MASPDEASLNEAPSPNEGASPDGTALEWPDASSGTASPEPWTLRYQGHGDGIGDYPIELCLHIEECMCHSCADYVKLNDETSFSRFLQVDAMTTSEAFGLEGTLNLNYAIQEQFIMEYRDRDELKDQPKPRCLFEPDPTERVPRAIVDGDVETLRQELERGVDPNKLTSSGIRLLSLAVVHLQVECVKLLLEYSADPNSRGYWRDARPLDYVIPFFIVETDFMQAAIIEFLINSGATFTYANVFHTICRMERLDLMVQAVRNGTPLETIRCSENATLLHRASIFPCRLGQPFIVNYILQQAPGLLNVKDKKGRTALHYALLGGNKQMPQFLLRSPVDAMAVDKNNESALHIAVRRLRHADVVALLNRPGVDIATLHMKGLPAFSPLCSALASGDARLIRIMLAHPRMAISEDVRSCAFVLRRRLGLSPDLFRLIAKLPYTQAMPEGW
ncbi:ankyrin [Aspergillus heteromorphus CBS 117.55]|uniref:Ankyrin n=1 Tax=Aspergillus heteromorphus CBS 117.55 TaxID=1448321 RepID=A0A317WQ90_9EURO|nr:ankyrin [Aspergillus heteromorphus CBS 117.55]PWY88215.1 ankyrin [Aspergillus heteromorphus CBS 117.55]